MRTLLVNLPRRVKRVIIILNDLFLLSLALWLGFSLRLSEFYVPPNLQFTIILMGAPLIGVATFQALGLYKMVIRFISDHGVLRIYVAVSLAVLIWSQIVFLAQVPGFLPRSTVIIYWFLSIFLIWSSRQFVGWALSTSNDVRGPLLAHGEKNVLIYGAGTTGVQLAQSLAHKKNYRAIGFIDDNPSLWRQNVNGYKVYAPDKIEGVIRNWNVKEIFLAMPGIDNQSKREVLAKIEHYPVSVQTLPAMEDIVSGRVSVSNLKPVEAIDLLGRDPVPPDPKLLMENIRGKNVLITGAGGSIGSELTRQIFEQNPKRLVMLELSELMLYQIDQKISLLASQSNSGNKDASHQPTQIVAVLGSVRDSQLIRNVIRENNIETIYHAAAYKHVPIVEANAVAGLRNNTFGTAEIAKVAKEMEVERFVLISTDKAVRPTNVMGASKRLAEMVLQAHADDPKSKTVFTMVRFGNVLDSSGSVVGRFRQQIETGGPVTVTHREINRYFMSIPEAAQLVIQAGAMAQGGEVFILEMGEPVKIDDLARTMIRLAGLKVIEESTCDGDIAIVYTGLRPGEKLYEELLIGSDAIDTKHTRICKCNEAHLPLKELVVQLDALNDAMNANDEDKISEILKQNVEGYVKKP